MKFLLSSILMTVSFTLLSQLDQFTNVLDTYFSKPEESGFMFFESGNNIAPDSCFHYYKTTTGDYDNDMFLVDTKTDTIANMTHYKFIQTYKGIPVEDAGCIEHFDQNGSLVFTNAKHAVNLNINTLPNIPPDRAIEVFLNNEIISNLDFAWNNTEAELGIQSDLNDTNATYYPNIELIISIDTNKNTHFNIEGNRYRLAYILSLTTVNPFETKIYYMDANNGQIFKTKSISFHDGPANIYGYGSRIIDTEWRGFPHYNYRLYANDATRKIHTKKKTGGAFSNWSTISNTTDNDDNWGSTYLTETTTHYFATRCWDFYRNRFGLIGMDGLNTEVRVRTEWNGGGAKYTNSTIPLIEFGKTSTGMDYGLEPSVVAHEYANGITAHANSLGNTFESGSLNESFSDIFGVVIQATMLDVGVSDWIVGNGISGGIKRSLIDPKFFGQPDTYLGDNWTTSGLPHNNGGVSNHWFYILSEGETDFNDNFDVYDVSGIGMLKSSWITYYAIQYIMQSSSQFSDARLATIQAAEALYGLCSIEYQSTIDAWYAVGIGNQNTCSFTAGLNSPIAESNVTLYPNPSRKNITIEVPSAKTKQISIYSSNGQLVQSVTNNKLITHIDISEHAKGMYSVVFNIDGQIIIKKLIID